MGLGLDNDGLKYNMLTYVTPREPHASILYFNPPLSKPKLHI